ncbi:MAG: hypothetical protein HDT16_02075 [Oscillibacter sp.]|nr:hypothetical protein [Oscillibacter sp.]
MENTYTNQQRGDAILLYNAIRATPPDKRSVVKVMANTFINGMRAQEQLTAQYGAHDSARESA